MHNFPSTQSALKALTQNNLRSKRKLFHMRNTILTAAFAALILLPTACKKELEQENMQFPALEPLRSDTGAGTWKTILLSRPDQIPVAAPVAVTSPDYRLELQEIVSRQERMEEADENNLKYWAAGTVLRWNEIMRELVAKYNLPPYQNPDGSYPFPDANNPLAYPYFPFANPPYAARAYAYASAAVYDALVAAAHYRSIYRRPLPSRTNPKIKHLIPVAGDWTYPSDDLTAAGASVAILSLMFPGEQDYLQRRLNECRDAILLSGTCSRSDAAAGEALGRGVAAVFIARARTDRAGASAGTPALWQQLEQKAIQAGETPWKSLETPPRPPMLPAFGKVKGFLLDSLEVVNNRPPAPPSVHSDQFRKELAEVLQYSRNPTRERLAIVHFWADGAGTYAPPGHWNAIACSDFVKERFSEVRWARNLALLNIAMFDAAICCWDAKYAYFNPRPSQVDPAIKTHTGVPNFPAFTSGHSTFSGAAATFLAHVVPSRAGTYKDMASEASLSRLYGAIHYRSDIDVGMDMGNMLGNKAVQRALTDGAE